MKLKGLVIITALLCCFAVFATAQNQLSKLPARVPHVSAANASATTPQKGTSARSEADTCAYTFTVAGANNDYMEFCVSVNGNVISFQSPDGIEYLDLALSPRATVSVTLPAATRITTIPTGASARTGTRR